MHKLPYRLPTTSERLLLLTDGEWSVAELRSLLEVVDAAYSVILALLLVRRGPSGSSNELMLAAPRRTEGLAVLSHFLGERATEEPRAWFSAAFSLLRFDLEVDSVNLRELIDVALLGQLRLTVSSVEMASPGFLLFRGLGEAIRELRELIKDVGHRNRHAPHPRHFETEAARAMVDRLRGSAAVAEPRENTRADLLIAAGLLEIGQLEARGLLRRVAESMDENDPPAPTD